MKKNFVLLLLSLISVYATSQPAQWHPWKGKRVAYFGDSITDPNVTTGPNNNHYWSYLQQWLGITPLVYGVNGRQWNDIPRQADQLKQDHNQNFDAILIFIGTNDYNHGLPLGEWYKETKEQVYAATGEPQKLQTRMMRTPALDGNTLRGRINIPLSKIRLSFPDKQVVILTPIHRGYASFGPNNVQPSETYQNKSGLFLSDYIDAIKEVSDVWAVPVIDISTLSGLLPQYPEFSVYFKNKDTDRLHPNELGHRKIAQALLCGLQSIPCGDF